MKMTLVGGYPSAGFFLVVASDTNLPTLGQQPQQILHVALDPSVQRSQTIVRIAVQLSSPARIRI